MKKLTIFFALLIFSVISANAVFADVKIKSRQTAAGQTFENTTYIKGKRQRTEQNMGAMQTVNLTQCDMKRSVQLNPAAKTYLVNLFTQNASGENLNQKVSGAKITRAGGTITTTATYKDTGEKRKMFGYEARRIITTMETVSSPDACAPNNYKMEIDGWYINAAFVLDCDFENQTSLYASNPKSGCQDKTQFKTVGNAKRGLPVYEKMTMFDQAGKETFSTVNEVVELSQATLDQALFEIPGDYREVKDSAEIYASSSNNSGYSGGGGGGAAAIPAGSNVDDDDGETLPKNPAYSSADQPSNDLTAAKKAGVVRIGVIAKTESVGEGIDGAELAAAVQNSLGEIAQGTKIEFVPLQAKLASLIESEAEQKQCDFVLVATVAHKKGGGGFGGMFGKAAGGMLGSVIPMGGNTGGIIAGQAASTVITAAAMSGSFKSKDEITLDVKMRRTGGAAVLSQQFKAKAKSNGDDIISKVVEQAAEAIVGKIG